MVNKKAKNAIPENWEKYSNIGGRIEGTNFVCFKCPLKMDLCQKVMRNHGPAMRWGTDDVIAKFDAISLKLGLVIDLTNTDRYYNKDDFLAKAIQYQKINCPGSHQIDLPPDEIYLAFQEAVDKFLAEIPKDQLDHVMIGVHCTHGLNRSGYLVCRYMVQRLGLSVPEAEARFNSARGHAIEKKHYLDHIVGLVALEEARKKLANASI